ncbi:eukaryotic translation initiation factor 4E type 3-like [Brachionus plicatilis]|uniref:Eukaryotic translation initiation factor 4E type 3-like n=1 Tax=Brachionus plicatilis TaxID=10195 RepID=A0A3M7RJC3_BRAPC|nr:eukaryotic translation initiation factor 4E type 3-like [Brachionus plicatilis]
MFNSQEGPELETNLEEHICSDDNQDYELESQWTWWIDKNEGLSTGLDYQKNLHKIGEFSTVKTFWSYFNNLPDVSSIECGFSYHLMKGDLRPVRENNEIANGGQFKIKCNTEFSSEVWLEILMAVIGEKLSELLDENDDFIGIRFGRRKREDTIQIWNSDASKVSKNKIINRIEELLPKKIDSYEYKSFKDLNKQYEDEFSERNRHQNRHQNRHKNSKKRSS